MPKLHPLDFECYMRQLDELRIGLTSCLAQGVAINASAVALGQSPLFTAADRDGVTALRDTCKERMKLVLREQGAMALERSLDRPMPYGALLDEIEAEDAQE